MYEYVFLLKAKSPCSDCKQFYPPVVMDFDHLPQFKKTKGIAHLIRNTHSMESIIKEIAKCELVCANCHRIRTSSRSKSVFTAGIEGNWSKPPARTTRYVWSLFVNPFNLHSGPPRATIVIQAHPTIGTTGTQNNA